MRLVGIGDKVILQEAEKDPELKKLFDNIKEKWKKWEKTMNKNKKLFKQHTSLNVKWKDPQDAGRRKDRCDGSGNEKEWGKKKEEEKQIDNSKTPLQYRFWR